MQSNISQFLEIFKVAVIGDENFRDDVCAVVLEKTKFPVSKSCITLKNNNVYIKADPYMKTEINLHKDGILESVRAKYPKKNILNIL